MSTVTNSSSLSGVQLLKLQLKIAKTFLFTPAAKSISLTRLRQFKSELKKVREIQQPAECWYLHLLGVDPKAQKMGIGRKLLQWGIDRSEEENISTCLEASMAGQPLYEKLGFEENGWMSFDEGKQRQQVMKRPPSTF